MPTEEVESVAFVKRRAGIKVNVEMFGQFVAVKIPFRSRKVVWQGLPIGEGAAIRVIWFPNPDKRYRPRQKAARMVKRLKKNGYHNVRSRRA